MILPAIFRMKGSKEHPNLTANLVFKLMLLSELKDEYDNKFIKKWEN